ncbi:MAG: hypothetical protein IT375_17990 [Polyangiaceae bacterium]|nr:hypothetical protein [Polyangiaceae bacterium]
MKKIARTFGVSLVLFAALLACKGGKSKAFAAFDKHRIDYGKCEIMAESKTEVGGKPAWIAATVCKTKHRQAVCADITTSEFDKHFDAWKKEFGAKAVEDARSAPATETGTASGSSGGDCPNGAACINRCRSDCESTHGKLIDLDKMKECTSSGGGADCVTKASNESARQCFLKCRGLSG